MTLETDNRKGTGISHFFAMNRTRFLILFIMLGILGAWMNAQGGWVKDFSYQKTVVLPFLFENYTTTGFAWYLVGLFDDLLGFSANLVGIYGFRRITDIGVLSIYGRKYFILPIVAYLITDLFAFLNFRNYYAGITSLSDYGLYWNILQYFVMIPCFILADLFVLLYRPGSATKR